MTRRDPVETVGGVRVYAPTPRCRSYRLRWTEPDGTPGDTTAGRDRGTALTKATTLDRRLSRAAGPTALTPLGQVFTAYLAHGIIPYTDRPWRASTRIQIEDNLGRTLRGHETVPALDLDRALCDRMRAQAGTPTMVRINTTAFVLLWGYRHSPSYFTAGQVEYLSPGVVMPRPALAGTPAPRRRVRTRRVGQAADYVEDEDAPSAAQVVALGEALEQLVGPWGRLAPELAANAGPRWGEQFQLTADDAHPDGCREAAAPHLHIDWQIDSGAHIGDPGGRRCPPKGDKTRIAPLSAESFTGFPLRGRLLARVEAARAEQLSGLNPAALLFPSPRYVLWWHSAFSADVLIPAMRTAGWPLREWTEVHDVWHASTRRYSRETRTRTLTVLSWHSHRHRFARVAIDLYRADPGVLMALGGWENEATVLNRYYRSGAEHTLRGLARFANRPDVDRH
ncbi:hypothetical protein [Nocardioides marmotae]|uniref:hypothetical protein n=1 Tax=Nocardioides marmotae TaxID=2663857 RepID=UPI0012B53611|nr:hypothetical protein [Nocardioides marmotae]MBC9733858.1 hypothetical protein [Nocardioides marmotae]MTB84961.1 hypothetical protein [Nocardioides marmotae]